MSPVRDVRVLPFEFSSARKRLTRMSISRLVNQLDPEEADLDATGGAEADLKEGESQERQRVRAEAGQRPEVPDDWTM